LLKGRLRRLMPVEGATRAPIIAAGIGSYWFDSGGEWTVRMEGSRIVFPALEKTIA